MPNNKPESEQDVFDVMRTYCDEKGYKYSDAQLRFMAEECFLLHESRGWKGTAYWPPLAKKWVLNAVRNKPINIHRPKPKPSSSKPEGKTVRDIIMEQEQDEF
jgi:hypothetical protein